MFFHSHILYSFQTLSQLDLYGNQIGDEGAQCLSEPLKKNRVSYRHFHNSTLDTITFELKVHNI